MNDITKSILEVFTDAGITAVTIKVNSAFDYLDVSFEDWRGETRLFEVWLSPTETDKATIREKMTELEKDIAELQAYLGLIPCDE